MVQYRVHHGTLQRVQPVAHDHTRVAHDDHPRTPTSTETDGSAWKDHQQCQRYAAAMYPHAASAHVCPNEIHPSLFLIKHHCLARENILNPVGFNTRKFGQQNGVFLVCVASF